MEKSNVLSIASKSRAKVLPWADDPKELPIYSISDVAQALRMGEGALSDWTKPKIRHGRKGENFDPLVLLPEQGLADGRLSFYNAIEAHMLLSMRRRYKVPMLEVRRALKKIRETEPSRHPLAEYSFQKKGKHLFLETIGENIDMSQGGQKILGEILDEYLTRIERDTSGVAFRLTPVLPGSGLEVRPVMMDMKYSSGKLVIMDTGIRVDVVHGRYRAGHSIEKLARDYRLTEDQIKGAIQYATSKAA